MILGSDDRKLMDEFVALYVGMAGNQNLEQKFREAIGGGQDQGALALTKSGDIEQYAVKNL